MTRAENWPDGLRWIVRRVKPSRRQMRNLTAYEKKPAGGTPSPAPTSRTRGSRASREATTRSTSTSCTASTPRRDRRRPHRESHGTARLPSKTWQVNCGWVAAANIAADLAAWTRLLGHGGEPGTPRRRPRHAPLPGLAHPRETRPPRPAADPRHQPRLAVGGSVPRLLAAALRPARTRLTTTDHPANAKGGLTRRGRSRCAPGHPGRLCTPRPEGKRTGGQKTDASTISYRTQAA